MHPIPCNHCGYNYMRQTTDPEAPRLCNSCAIREEKRAPTKKDHMQTIDIMIKCPVQIHAKIEEYCICKGISLSQYFLGLDLIVDTQSDYIREMSVTKHMIKGIITESAGSEDIIEDPKPLLTSPTKTEQKKQKRS